MEKNNEVVFKTYNLCKSYKGRRVLNNVNMTINKGDIYGFVGENGAGKTTIIRALTGLINCESGELELFGVKNSNPEYYKQLERVSAIVESPSIYTNLSAFDNILYQQKLLGIENEEMARNLLQLVGLNGVSDSKKAGNFSLGMRQRLAIAMCLVASPEFMIFDEPMNGLDPVAISQVRNLILDLNRIKGITFLISSHILSELDLVANKYGIISHGNIVLEESRSSIASKLRKTTIFNTSDDEKAYNLLVSNGYNAEKKDNLCIYDEFNNNEVFKLFIDNNIMVNGIETKEASFEDFYLSLLGGRKNA